MAKSKTSVSKATTNGEHGTKTTTSTDKRLPLARVKKIAKMDEDVIAISNAAALVLAGATEKFAAYFAEQSYFYTLADKKRVLHYKHCASAVARLPQLDFLADVVPQTVRLADTEQYKTLVARRKKEDAEARLGIVPEWARAHPEVYKKIEAAQKERVDGADDEARQADRDAKGGAGVPVINGETDAPSASSLLSPLPTGAATIQNGDVEMADS